MKNNSQKNIQLHNNCVNNSWNDEQIKKLRAILQQEHSRIKPLSKFYERSDNCKTISEHSSYENDSLYDDVYTDEGLLFAIENDELSPQDEGFLRGYVESY